MFENGCFTVFKVPALNGNHHQKSDRHFVWKLLLCGFGAQLGCLVFFDERSLTNTKK